MKAPVNILLNLYRILIVLLHFSSCYSGSSGARFGGLKFGYNGKTYSFSSETCPGGVIFKKPLALDFVCPDGYFLQRSKGCSSKEERIIGADEYACILESSKTKAMVQALISITNPESPTDHTLTLYDDKDLLTSLRRYSIVSVKRNEYIPRDNGSSNIIAINPRKIAGMNVGKLCYRGAASAHGAAFKVHVDGDFGGGESFGFFSKGCKQYSVSVDPNLGNQFDFDDGAPSTNRFTRENVARMDGGETDVIGDGTASTTSTGTLTSTSAPDFTISSDLNSKKTTEKGIAHPTKKTNGKSEDPDGLHIEEIFVDLDSKVSSPSSGSELGSKPDSGSEPETGSSGASQPDSIVGRGVNGSYSDDGIGDDDLPPQDFTNNWPDLEGKSLSKSGLNSRKLGDNNDNGSPEDFTNNWPNGTVTITVDEMLTLPPCQHLNDSCEGRSKIKGKSLIDLLEKKFERTDYDTDDDLKASVESSNNKAISYLKDEVVFDSNKAGLHFTELRFYTNRLINNFMYDDNGVNLVNDMELPKKTKWFQILEAYTSIAKTVIPAKSFPKEMYTDILSIFGYMFKTLEDNPRIETPSEQRFQAALKILGNCLASPEMKKPEFKFANTCPERLSSISVSGWQWNETYGKYDAGVDFTIPDARRFDQGLLQTYKFRTGRHLIVELMFMIFDIGRSYCTMDFKQDLNTHSSIGLYIMDHVFHSPRVQSYWRTQEQIPLKVYLTVLPHWNNRDFNELILEQDVVRYAIRQRVPQAGWMKDLEPSIYDNEIEAPTLQRVITRRCRHCAEEFRRPKDDKAKEPPFFPSLKWHNQAQRLTGARSRVLSRGKIDWTNKRKRRAIYSSGSLKKVTTTTTTTTTTTAPSSKYMATTNQKIPKRLTSREIWNGLAYCLSTAQITNNEGQIQQLGLDPSLQDFREASVCE